MFSVMQSSPVAQLWLVLLSLLLPVGETADLVIRIPGNGQPKDGYYRLDYR